MKQRRYSMGLPAFVVLVMARGGVAADTASGQSAIACPAWKQGQQVSYVITCEEDRETQHAGADRPTVLSLRRTLHLTLNAESIAPDGGGSIECTVDRIQIEGDNGGRAIRYDSRHDRPGNGNSVADLLSNIAGQRFRVRLGPGGEFKAVAGLDGIWRAKGLLAAPVPVLSIQFLFRDQGMLALLREALAPPVPADLHANSPAWTARLPLNVPGVTLLEWPATFRVDASESTDTGSSVGIKATGGLEVVRPMADVGSAGLSTSVAQGSRQADLRVDGTSKQVLNQQILHDLALTVTLVPPNGGQTLRTQIRQKIKLTATRE